MPWLKIDILWDGWDKPSCYNPVTNVITVNPYYYDSYPSWMWFIPLIHEVGHWLIKRCLPESPPPPFKHITNILHVKLDHYHAMILEYLSGDMYWDHPIAVRNRQILRWRNVMKLVREIDG